MSPMHWAGLARNPKIEQAHVDRFVRDFLARLPNSAQDRDLGWAVIGVARWEERGFEVGPARAALLEWLGNLKEWGAPFECDAEREAVVYLAGSKQLDAAGLRQMYDFFLRERGWSRHFVVQLLAAPAAGPDLWEAALADYGRTLEIRLALARIEGARRHPPVAAVLERTRSQDLLQILAEEASPEEFPRLFRRYAAVLAERGGHCSNAFTDVQMATLSRQDLLPLLTSASEQVRIGALRMLPHVRGGEGRTEDVAPARRTGRRR
jgi:hypothetical protein